MSPPEPGQDDHLAIQLGQETPRLLRHSIASEPEKRSVKSCGAFFVAQVQHASLSLVSRP